MDKFEVLTEVYGLKPQGKSAPMASSRTSQNLTTGSTFDYPNISSRSTSLDPSFYKEIDDFNFGEKTESDKKIEDDLFGLTFKLSKSGEGICGNSSFDYDFIFGGSADSNFDSSFNNLHEERLFDSVAECDMLGFDKQHDKSNLNSGNLLGDFGDMDLGFADLKIKNSEGEIMVNESVSDDLLPGFGGCFHHIHSDADKRTEEKGSYVLKKNQQNYDENEMDLFFSGGGERIDAQTKTQDFNFDTFFENKGGSAVTPTRSNRGVQVNIKKECAKSDTHGFSVMFDDLKPCGDFNEIDGESEERRAARWKRHQEKIQRMAKAVSDMNQRDLETLHQQEERYKISEIVNIEIKQWVTGKEGNLRALLSTLHKVVWRECGWEAVPLTELITSTSVKKVYKKATLCLHPDKVQQKGASVRQKYMAEKIFDILKEAWNKFNTEELR